LKYTVSYKTSFGTVSAESSRPEELVRANADLKKLASQIQSPSSVSIAKPRIRQREGKGETTAVLRALESRLLQTNFFSEPRTTGETQRKLEGLARRKFTSRKVSQALGILREKGILRRTGKRNFFKYSTV
jgi:hypothetical protein